MDTRNKEIERFKTEINLSEYAASVGFKIDKRESSKRSIVMRNGADKIAVARGTDDHYIYYSFRNATDNGSIIDFIQHRHESNIGRIRKELRPWIGESAYRPAPPIAYYQEKIEHTEKDRQKILMEFSKQEEITGENTYLTRHRLIPEAVYQGERFKGKIYTDRYKNAVFPHFDDQGLCGFEKKNKGYTGFPAGGTKTVWISNVFKTDNNLVIVESGIEALSHYALYQPVDSRYVSMSGSWSEQAMSIVKALAENFQGNVIMAFNNDDPGRQLEEKFKEEISNSVQLKTDRPELEGEDWNEMLKRLVSTNTI